jgi:RNA-directed DNA polymerase
MALFEQAITTELSNMAELREVADKFPIGDIGVAQGNSLSPLMGNVILHGFDKRMNEGDCQCIRYIDDFIIIAPDGKAAMARLKLAKKILSELSMEFAEDKGNKEPIAITETFEYLGIEFSAGYVRPAPKAVKKLLDKVKQTFELSKMQFARSREGKERITKAQSFLGAMKLVDGSIQGWSKHYWFCNDPAIFRNLDDQIERLIIDFIGAYRDERFRSREDKKRRRLLLGLEQISEPSRPHRYLPFKIDGTFEPRVKPKEVVKLEPAMESIVKKRPIKPTKENMESAIDTQKAMKLKK